MQSQTKISRLARQTVEECLVVAFFVGLKAKKDQHIMIVWLGGHSAYIIPVFKIFVNTFTQLDESVDWHRNDLFWLARKPSDGSVAACRALLLVEARPLRYRRRLESPCP